MSDEGRHFNQMSSHTAAQHQYSTRPYGAVVTSSNPAKDTLTYEGPSGGRSMPISHPYLGPTSWIRVMPERRTGMILNSRSDSGEPYIAAYAIEETSESLISSTYANPPTFYYRRLRESEIDVVSSGIAEAHFGQSGSLSLRGGPLTQVFDVENLEVTSSSPTFKKWTTGHLFDVLSNESRFGIVKRVSSDADTAPLWVKVPDAAGVSTLAKENSYQLSSNSDTSPLLIDRREGNVIDDLGVEILSSVTGKKLRSRSLYGTFAGTETAVEVDTNGNASLYLPDGATYGVDLNISRGSFKLTIGKDELHNVESNVVIRSGNSHKVESNVINLNANKFILMEAQEIHLGENAVDPPGPIVRGEDLRTWLGNAKILTAMGPAFFSTDDLALPFTDTLSTKVFSE